MATPVEIKIDASVSGADKVDGLSTAIDQLGKEAQDAGASTGKANEAIDRLGDSSVAATDDVQRVVTEVDKLGETAKDTGQKVDSAATSLEDVAVSAKNATGDVSQLEKVIDKLGIETQSVSASTGKAAQGIDAVGKSATTTGKAVAASNDFLNEAINDWNNTGKAATTAATGVDRANTALSKTKPEADKAKDGIKSVGDSSSLSAQAVGQLAAAMAAGFSVQQFVQAAAQVEQLAAGFRAVTGDAKEAAAQMDFVRRMAGAAGVDVVAAGQAFLGLAASTKGTAVEGKMAADVFEAVTVSMAKAGKSSAETQNALLALSQMASKGVVSMEELRGQLGEALPGALQAAASGLGVTTTDLIKLVESGKVAAEDIFPALTKGLTELYGTAPQAQTLSQEIANLKNAFTDMASRIGEAGVLDALKVGAESAQTALVFLGESFTVVGQQIGVMAAAVTSLDFSGVSQAMRDIEEASRTNLLRAAEHNTVLRAALKGMGDEAIQSALAAKEAGDTAQKSGAQAEASAGSWVSMSLAYTNANKAIAETIAASTKEIELIKATGQAAIERARLSGEEVLVRQATQRAATAEADAVQALAALRLREVAGLEAELAAKRSMLAENGKISETRKKEVEELEKLITVKRIEAQTTEAQAAALRSKTQANSDEAIAATAALKATEANRISRVAEAQAIVSGLTAQKELARQTESIAALMGNETEVRKAKIKQVELEIQITNAKVAVAKAEAEGSIAVAKAKLAEMEATKQIDPVKRAELEASIKIAQAKLVEAEAVGNNTAVLREQINILSSTTTANNSMADSTAAVGTAANRTADAIELLNTKYQQSSSYTSRQIALLNEELSKREALMDLKQREIDLENRRRGVDKEGFRLDKNGNREVQQLQSQRSVYENAKGQGLSEAYALALAKRFVSDSGELIGWGAADSSRGENWGTELQKAIDAAVLANAAKAAQADTMNQATTTSQPPAKVYEVRINGSTYTASSDADAQKLVQTLQNARLAA